MVQRVEVFKAKDINVRWHEGLPLRLGVALVSAAVASFSHATDKYYSELEYKKSQCSSRRQQPYQTNSR